MATSREVKVRFTADTSELDAAIKRAQSALDGVTAKSTTHEEAAYIQVETNSRYTTTKVYAVFRDGRRIPLTGIKAVDVHVGRHDIATGVIHCDLACELTGHKEP